jgi:hypothetical protein
MLKQHTFYNTENYPNYILTESNWSIWANGAGMCASIPTPKMQRQGCRAAPFGDMLYLGMARGIKLYPR